MIGPYMMGNTSDLNGIWAIYYRLHILVQWGTKEYREWFVNEVLGDLKAKLE